MNQTDSERPVVLTDPARELVELCQSLIGGGSNKPGGQYLADRFGVAPYSTDFFRVLAAISGRIDQLTALLASSEIDSDFEGEMLNHLAQIRLVFADYGLQNHWTSGAATRLVAENLQPLKALSPLIRRTIS